MRPLYFIEAGVTLFCVAFIFFLIRGEVLRGLKERRKKVVGIRREAATLHSKIKYCSHRAELQFITDEIMDFESRHRGEKECYHLYEELMLAANEKEPKLARFFPKVSV